MTPILKLINKIHDNEFTDLKGQFDVSKLQSYCEQLYYEEKELILNAHNAGQAFAIGSHIDFSQIHPNAEEYYNILK